MACQPAGGFLMPKLGWALIPNTIPCRVTGRNIADTGTQDVVGVGGNCWCFVAVCLGVEIKDGNDEGEWAVVVGVGGHPATLFPGGGVGTVRATPRTPHGQEH